MRLFAAADSVQMILLLNRSSSFITAVQKLWLLPFTQIGYFA
jgi:hypothetical protein